MHLDGGELLNVSPVRTREPDDVCAQAVDLARRAAEELAGAAAVGEHLGVEADGERVVTHLFNCLDPGYRGWRWAVTVARASRARNVTADEVVLVPGPDAILAPPWVPWRERVRPGDLGAGDILPAAPDDERLVPATVLEGDDDVEDLTTIASQLASLAESAVSATAATEMSVSCARVLSAIGRDEAALRWYTGEHGPRSPLAHLAPGACLTCGFFVRLGGPLGQVFGVCANSYAPDDGRVVSADHGCGGHSEALPSPAGQVVRPVIDELGYDLVDVPGVSVEETVFETLDPGSG
jgi:hypothetical protein